MYLLKCSISSSPVVVAAGLHAFAILQVFAELKDLAHEITSAELVSPTLIIIGNVVSLSPFWPHSSKEVPCFAAAI